MVEGRNDRIGTRVLMGTVEGTRLQRVSEGLATLKLTLPGGVVQTLDARAVMDVRPGASAGTCEVWCHGGVLHVPFKADRAGALVREVQEECAAARRRDRVVEADVDLSGLLSQTEVRRMKGCRGEAVRAAAKRGEIEAVTVAIGLRRETRYRRESVACWMPVDGRRRVAPSVPIGTVSREKVAEAAGCSVHRVVGAMDRGQLETVRRRGKRFVVRSSADKWAARQRAREIEKSGGGSGRRLGEEVS